MCFQLIVVTSIHLLYFQNGPSITEALYRNRANLETIFRMMDKDNSGKLTTGEETGEEGWGNAKLVYRTATSLALPIIVDILRIN